MNRHKMYSCLVNPAQLGPIKAHTAVPIAYYQAFLGKHAQRKHNNAATKGEPLIIKGSAGMKKTYEI